MMVIIAFIFSHLLSFYQGEKRRGSLDFLRQLAEKVFFE
jgi:hypothetical protein